MKLLKLREFFGFELNLSVEQTFLSEDGFMALGPGPRTIKTEDSQTNFIKNSLS